MKVLTSNYTACAVKACKSSELGYPLHFKDAVLAREELDLRPEFITSIFTRLDWAALRTTAAELGFNTLPAEKPETLDEQTIKDLHTLLLETQVVEGKLVCANCEHEYQIKEGIANFLLPNHLGMLSAAGDVGVGGGLTR